MTRVDAMEQTLADLRDLHQRVAINASQVSPKWYDYVSAVGWFKEAVGINTRNAGVQEGLRVTAQSIAILEGREQSRHGNFFNVASYDDSAFAEWRGHAKQTGDTLSVALGHSSYDVDKFLRSVANQVKVNTLAAVDEVDGTLGMLAIIAVAVLLIVVLK